MSLNQTPKANRLHIVLLGRTNVGKSSFLNFISGQNYAIVSNIAGTTTDLVYKTMEFLPIGPVVWIDTAGLDDESILGELRKKKTQEAINRADVGVLITEAGNWTEFDQNIFDLLQEKKLPFIIVVNKIDLFEGDPKEYVRGLKDKLNFDNIIYFSTELKDRREEFLNNFKEYLVKIVPKEFISQPPLIGDLVPAGGLAVLVVPIDLQAPKGRLILPQVQTIRDALDNDAFVMVVKERELPFALSILNKKPDIVITDSQVVLKVSSDVPKDVKFTTFSILFSRLKGDLVEQARGAAYIDALKSGDKVLIAEACTHHVMEDDIGRVKIPRWIRQYVGGDIEFDVYSGFDYPENLQEYKLVIHCGGCMLNRKEMLYRLHKAKSYNVPITNYGVTISKVHGLLERTLSPFPVALMAYKKELNKIRNGK